MVSEDSSVSDGDKNEATKEQQVQYRLLMRSDRVSGPSIKYSLGKDQLSFVLVIKAEDPSIHKKAIEADEGDKWAIAMEQEMKSLQRNQT